MEASPQEEVVTENPQSTTTPQPINQLSTKRLTSLSEKVTELAGPLSDMITVDEDLKMKIIRIDSGNDQIIIGMSNDISQKLTLRLISYAYRSGTSIFDLCKLNWDIDLMLTNAVVFQVSLLKPKTVRKPNFLHTFFQFINQNVKVLATSVRSSKQDGQAMQGEPDTETRPAFHKENKIKITITERLVEKFEISLILSLSFLDIPVDSESANAVLIACENKVKICAPSNIYTARSLDDTHVKTEVDL